MDHPRTPCITVIISVYNIEQWLEPCLESVAKQTFDNFEAILVDDGSTDASSEIADRFAASDARFRVIHQENRGPGAARNRGIDCARGAYIAFVDGDDTVHPRFLEELFEAAESTGARIAMCDYAEGDDGAWKFLDIFKGIQGEMLDQHSFWHGCYGVNPGSFIYLWNKLFRSDVFAETRFPESYNCEDHIIALRLYCNAGPIALVRETLYFYRIRESGQSRAGYLRPQFYESFVLAAGSFLDRDALFASQGWTDVRVRNLKKLVSYLETIYKGKDEASLDVLNEYKLLRKRTSRICAQIISPLLRNPKAAARIIAFLLDERLFLRVSKLRAARSAAR